MASTQVVIDISDLNRFNRKMKRFNKAFMPALRDLMFYSSLDLLQTTVRNASGRPGPNIVTGEYVSSFYSDYGPTWFQVTTNAPQANRLEFGFYGQDSLGRVYHQQPYPHLIPALNEVADRALKEIHQLADALWKVTS